MEVWISSLTNDRVRWFHFSTLSLFQCLCHRVKLSFIISHAEKWKSHNNCKNVVYSLPWWHLKQPEVGGVWDILTSSHFLHLLRQEILRELAIRLQESPTLMAGWNLGWCMSSFQWPIKEKSSQFLKKTLPVCRLD